MMKLLVCVGSYERILHGFDVSLEINHKKYVKISSKDAFSLPAHSGSIKVLESSPKFLLSGGTDEEIKIFDLEKRKEIGSLAQHAGTISDIVLFNNTHLISSSEDGTLCIFRTCDWESLHVLKHKKPVRSVALHPSGKLALSAGDEKSLKLWNLMTAKQAHSTKLPHQSDQIRFSPDGSMFASLCVQREEIVVFKLEDNLEQVIKIDNLEIPKLARIQWLGSNKIVFCGQGCKIGILDISEAIVKYIESGFTGPRIKDICIVKDEIITAVSSNGEIFGWDSSWNKIFDLKTNGLRITCLTVTKIEN